MFGNGDSIERVVGCASGRSYDDVKPMGRPPCIVATCATLFIGPWVLRVAVAFGIHVVRTTRSSNSKSKSLRSIASVEVNSLRLMQRFLDK